VGIPRKRYSEKRKRWTRQTPWKTRETLGTREIEVGAKKKKKLKIRTKKGQGLKRKKLAAGREVGPPV